MPDVLKLWIDRLATPIGELLVVADEAGNVRAVDWTDYEDRMVRLLRLHYRRHGYTLEPKHNPHGLSEVLERYFAGDVDAIKGVPVATAGTPFQREVWTELRNIPSGRTVTYGKLAEIMARPKAVRAIGLANGSNPISIVVPCHRVVGANGSLTGYGGGLDRKRWLLDHERQYSIEEFDRPLSRCVP